MKKLIKTFSPYFDLPRTLLLLCLSASVFSGFAQSCPNDLTCQNGRLRLRLDAPPPNTPQYFFCFGPTDYRNGTYPPLPQSTFSTPDQPPPATDYVEFAIFCDGTENITVSISSGPSSGFNRCTYTSGSYCYNCELVSCGVAPEECLDKILPCLDEFTSYLEPILEDVECKQWEGPCSDSPIFRSGPVAIGTGRQAPMGLAVKRALVSDEIKIEECEVAVWCDYVFEPDYDRLCLPELRTFLDEQQHLPGIPPAEQLVAAGGFELGDMTLRYQEKIEELFLHLIDLQNETKALEGELNQLLAENQRLKAIPSPTNRN